MTPGMTGAVTELSEKKRRYLGFVQEWVDKSLATVRDFDEDDEDFEEFQSLMYLLKDSLNACDEAIDDLIAFANVEVSEPDDSDRDPDEE